MSASGKEEDKTKVLVVYGTRWGGTAGVASRISEVLRGNGFNVDVENARRKLSKISDYDAVIVGSGIRANQWTKNVLTFLEKNARDLRKKKTAFFVSCSVAERTETEIREKAKEA